MDALPGVHVPEDHYYGLPDLTVHGPSSSRMVPSELEYNLFHEEAGAGLAEDDAHFLDEALDGIGGVDHVIRDVDPQVSPY